MSSKHLAMVDAVNDAKTQSEHDIAYWRLAAATCSSPLGGAIVAEQKMNPEIKARWVAALRSGGYKQTRGRLRHGDSFCCLGVLCDLHDAGLWQTYGSREVYAGNTALPPEAVDDWSGWCDQPVEIGGVRARISAHNDGELNDGRIPARTFAEIADAIEAQL
jgi:hypothetical protein